jgi:hypothetical protein
MILTSTGSAITGLNNQNNYYSGGGGGAGMYEDIDCEAWLSEIDLKQYTETFITNLSNDGRIILRKRLLQIRQQDLAKMNITNFVHQKLIMEHIKLILKHPFNSPLRKKEVLTLSPDAKAPTSNGKNMSMKSSSSGGEKLEGKFDRALGSSHSSSGNHHSDHAESKDHKKSAEKQHRRSFENKIDPERRRSFDEQIWNSISNMRHKPNEHTAAADHLRSQHTADSDGPEHLVIDGGQPATGRGTGGLGSNASGATSGTGTNRRRRTSFGENVNDESFPLNNQRDKANLYGNMALEYDMMMKDLKTLQQEYLNKFRMIINCEKASIFFVNHMTRELLLFADDDKSNTTTWFRIPQGAGIAGYCAETGERVNIPDAYEDPRFNKYVSLVNFIVLCIVLH